jgi:hypothetical protein
MGSAQGEAAEATQGKKDHEKVCIDISFSKETLIHSTHQNKWAMIDPSDLLIKHVSIKIDAFQRDLRISCLRSPIEATVQKVKIWSTLKPLSNET